MLALPIFMGLVLCCFPYIRQASLLEMLSSLKIVFNVSFKLI